MVLALKDFGTAKFVKIVQYDTNGRDSGGFVVSIFCFVRKNPEQLIEKVLADPYNQISEKKS